MRGEEALGALLRVTKEEREGLESEEVQAQARDPTPAKGKQAGQTMKTVPLAARKKPSSGAAASKRSKTSSTGGGVKTASSKSPREGQKRKKVG